MGDAAASESNIHLPSCVVEIFIQQKRGPGATLLILLSTDLAIFICRYQGYYFLLHVSCMTGFLLGVGVRVFTTGFPPPVLVASRQAAFRGPGVKAVARVSFLACQLMKEN